MSSLVFQKKDLQIIGKSRQILFEVLEPRIMLSADGLLNAIIPNQDQNTLLDSMQEAVQNAELLDTNEQAEVQINPEPAPSDTPNAEVYEPILTLYVDDDNTHDESANADLIVDNIGSAQVNGDIAVLSSDFGEDIESKVGAIEDDSPPIYVNDNDISIEKTTSIEIRGPPFSNTGLGEATNFFVSKEAGARALQEIIYVDCNATTGANNGLSWADAYVYLQDALAVADSGDEIWVAEGVYKPDRGGSNTLGDPEATFQILNGVTIKGGYAGFGEPDSNARDIELYETILSGDIGVSGDHQDNSSHIVTASGTDSTAALDGFTIASGKVGMYNDSSRQSVGDYTFGGNSAVYENLAENPSMEGSFIPQDPMGNVAEYWTGWEGEGWWGDSLEGEFSQGDIAHTGGKSQKIKWDNPYPDPPGKGEASFGYDGVYQQIDQFQPGQIYRASFWFKGEMWTESYSYAHISILGGIGVDSNGGANPNAVTHWSEVWKQANSSWAHPDPLELPWSQVTVCFSPSGSTATIFIRMWGNGHSYDEYPLPDGTINYIANAWYIEGYIDDAVVESVEIGTGSTVEATSPIPANGVGRSEVTITVVDSNGDPLAGIPASEITVDCTGSGNTIVGPGDPTDANGVTTAYITSTVAETKTVSVMVFGRPLSGTAVVEFFGSFGPIWYVDGDATGTDAGSNWADAFNDLQDALKAASAGEEIHVAQGTYTPGSGRTVTFQLNNGVTIKGGYAGFGEPDPDAWDIEAYETILSGDLYGNDDDPGYPGAPPPLADNSYHVVTGSGTDETAILDGFTITAGNANGSSYPHLFGGGMITESNGSPTLIDCTFTVNSAQFGGGMGNYNSGPTLTNCTFSSNWANSGGGIANDANSSPTLINCEFRDNSAEYGGGMRNYSSSPTVTDCTFSGNSATYGGGMRNYSSNPILTNCTFTGNSAESHGGGMFNQDSSPAVTNCAFGGNSATYGGAMYSYQDSSPAVTNCLFSSNSADYGGGVLNFSSSPMLTNCTFTANSAENYGGAMYNEGNGSPTVTGCLFSSNSADYGGGVLNFSSSPMLTNCTFTANSADSYGGGIYEFDNNPTVIGCAFSGNVAGIGGGGTAIKDSTTTIVNCTFSGNTAANGNALACESEPKAPSNVELANCILWDGGNEIWNNDGSTITVSYSDVQGGWTGQGNIDANPGFVDPSSDDYHLMPDSPCIDAGDNSAVPAGINTDLDGKPRFSDDPDTDDTGSGTPPLVDMGAYEYSDAPLANDDAYTTDEDTTLVVAALGVLTNDIDDDSLTAILDTGPSNGTLTLNADGSFTYTPALNFNGTDSFIYYANDGSLDSNFATVTITVNTVNDAPSFTKGSDVVVNEDSGPYTESNWATNISAGPANESSQTVGFNVSNDNNSLFSVQPAISNDGTLTFTPAPDSFSSATVTVIAQDDGGTANGGQDTSAPQIFVITVNSVNDAPVADAGSDQTIIDTDDNGSEQVSLDGSSSSDVQATWMV